MKAKLLYFPIAVSLINHSFSNNPLYSICGSIFVGNISQTVSKIKFTQHLGLSSI